MKLGFGITCKNFVFFFNIIFQQMSTKASTQILFIASPPPKLSKRKAFETFTIKSVSYILVLAYLESFGDAVSSLSIFFWSKTKHYTLNNGNKNKRSAFGFRWMLFDSSFIFLLVSFAGWLVFEPFILVIFSHFKKQTFGWCCFIRQSVFFWCLRVVSPGCVVVC